jgi:hypothetical protein
VNITTDDVDCFAVTLTDTAAIRATINSAACSDFEEFPQVGLYTADGTEIATDSFGFENCGQVTELVDAGTYLVCVDASFGDTATAVNLDITVIDVPPDAAGGLDAPLDVGSLPFTQVDGIVGALDEDCYRFTLTETQVVTFTASGTCETDAEDPRVDLYDDNQAFLDSARDSADNDCPFLEALLDAGTYIACYSADVGDPVFDMTVSLFAGDEDCFSFDVGSAQTVVIDTSDGNGACPADTVVTLRAADGTSITTNDDGGIDFPGTGACSLLTRTLDPGTYQACVKLYSSTNSAPAVVLRANVQ